MVDQQVRTWEVLDPRVLRALGAVERERFVPEAYRDVAFADAPIPIGHGQSLLAPKLHGRILQALELEPGSSALEIGTGTGYLSACLGLLAAGVRTLEVHAALAAIARSNLRGCPGSITVETADALATDLGGPWDAIAVTASLPRYDARFEQALSVGGRLFVVVGAAPVMEATLVRRMSATAFARESLFETVIEPLEGAAPISRFVF
jgi:protein-L-isoaspartate(D-aspartate) O-methyltransferase